MKRTVLFLMIVLAIISSGCQNSSEMTNDEKSEEPEITSEEVRPIVPLSELPTFEYQIEEIHLHENDQLIYGVVYLPVTDHPTPAIILSHGLGGNYQDATGYAETFASHGIAAVTFDFRGGGGSRSDGETTDMSVMTEVSDLESILNEVRSWEDIDSDKIVLLGASQGGLVSAIVAADHPKEVAGLILTYPAFSVSDVLHGFFDSPDAVPEVYDFGYITLGRKYAADFWDYDIYKEIGKYDKKVLLLHGSEDPVVSIEYSDRAAEIYKDVDYHIIDGAEHGFYDEDFEISLNYIFDYLQMIGII